MYSIDILTRDDRSRITEAPLLLRQAKDSKKKKIYETLASIHERVIAVGQPLVEALFREDPNSWLGKELSHMLRLKEPDPRKALAERIVAYLKDDVYRDPDIPKSLSEGRDVRAGRHITSSEWDPYFETFAKLVVLDGDKYSET